MKPPSANPNESVIEWLESLCRALDAADADAGARLKVLAEAAARADQELQLVPWRRMLRSEAHLIARGGATTLLQLCVARTERSPQAQAADTLQKAGRFPRAWIRRRGRPREERSGPCWRTLEVGRGALLGLELLSDQRRALALFEDKHIYLLDLERGITLRVEPLEASALATVRVGYETLLFAAGEGQLSVLDVNLNWKRNIALRPGLRVSGLVAAQTGVVAVLGADGSLSALRADGDAITPPKALAVPAASIAALPQGSRFLLGGADGLVRFWDVESGSVRAMKGHTGRVTALVACPDGRRALSGAEDQCIRVWEVESGKSLSTLQGHIGPITALAVGRGSRFALSSAADRNLRFWDIDSGGCLKIFPGHAAPAPALVFASDERRALSGAADQTVRVWDLEASTPLGIGEGLNFPVSSVVFLPGGRRALSASVDSTLKIWDTEAGACLQTIRTGQGALRSALPLPDGRSALLAAEDGQIRTWDLDADRVLRTIKAHSGRVEALSLTLEGRRLLSAGIDGQIKLWELESGRLLRTFTGHLAPIRHLALYPDGRRVVSLSLDGTLRVWDLDTGNCIGTHRGAHYAEASVFALHPEGVEFVLGMPSGAVIFDLATGRRLRELVSRPGSAEHVLYTAQGAQVAAAGYGKALEVYPALGGAWVVRWDNDAPITAFASSPGGRFALGDSLGGVVFLDVVRERREGT